MRNWRSRPAVVCHDRSTSDLMIEFYVPESKSRHQEAIDATLVSPWQ